MHNPFPKIAIYISQKTPGRLGRYVMPYLVILLTLIFTVNIISINNKTDDVKQLAKDNAAALVSDPCPRLTSPQVDDLNKEERIKQSQLCRDFITQLIRPAYDGKPLVSKSFACYVVSLSGLKSPECDKISEK